MPNPTYHSVIPPSNCRSPHTIWWSLFCIYVCVFFSVLIMTWGRGLGGLKQFYFSVNILATMRVGRHSSPKLLRVSSLYCYDNLSVYYFCIFLRPLWNIPRELISSRHYGDERCKYSSQWGSVDIRPHVNKGFPFILLWQPDCIHVYIFIARCDIFRPTLNGSNVQSALWRWTMSIFGTIRDDRHQAPC